MRIALDGHKSISQNAEFPLKLYEQFMKAR